MRDDLAEWLCFAFSLVNGEAFFLQRDVYHPPTHEFVLSVTAGLFSVNAAGRIVEALGVAGARATHVSDEAAP